MAMDKYIKMEEIEKLVEVIVDVVLEPALKRVVADSSNAYDDAALAIAMPMIKAAINKIDGEEG